MAINNNNTLPTKQQIIKSLTPQTTLLPVLTKVYHSTKLNESNFKGFDVIHNKLFVTAISHFQDEIVKSLHGQQHINFDDFDNSKLKIPIYLNEIVAQPSAYEAVYLAAKQMEELKVEQIRMIDNVENVAEIRVFAEVWKPTKLKKKSIITVVVDKIFFKEMADVFYKDPAKAYYLQYYKEVVMKSKNKYLPKLYWTLTQFTPKKENGGFFIKSMSELLEIIGIDPTITPSYLEPKNLNSRVLNPIKTELYSTCGFYFTYTFHKYKEKGRENEYYYKFTILGETELSKNSNQIQFIEKLLLELFPSQASSIFNYITTKDVQFSNETLIKLSSELLAIRLSKKYETINDPLAYFKAIIDSY
jgi:hypothetical protein